MNRVQLTPRDRGFIQLLRRYGPLKVAQIWEAERVGVVPRVDGEGRLQYPEKGSLEPTLETIRNRLSRLVGAHLLEWVNPVFSQNPESGLTLRERHLRPTRLGLEQALVGDWIKQVPAPTGQTMMHNLAAADVGLRFEAVLINRSRGGGAASVYVSEAELRCAKDHASQIEPDSVFLRADALGVSRASVAGDRWLLGSLTGIPDALILSADRVTALEVELTPKTSSTYRTRLNEFSRLIEEGSLHQVRYLVRDERLLTLIRNIMGEFPGGVLVASSLEGFFRSSEDALAA